jgi:hypothetical protein
MVDSDIRVARLLQAAAVLTTSGHTRADAVMTAIELEKKIIAIVEQDSEKPRLKEGNDSR